MKRWMRELWGWRRKVVRKWGWRVSESEEGRGVRARFKAEGIR